MRYLMLAVLMVVTVVVTTLQAQSPNLERPLDLRVTGTLLAADTPKSDDVVVVDVTVGGKPFVLRIGKVEDLTHTERTQARKHDVLFEKVRFTGATELMEYLHKPETLGKVITIEGWLNTTTRRFQVTAVKDGNAPPLQTP